MSIDLSPVSILLFSLNLITGVAMWLLKMAYQDLKDQTKETRTNLEQLNREAYKKEDFKEFKEELWRRFDKLEIEVNQKIQEVKHG